MNEFTKSALYTAGILSFIFLTLIIWSSYQKSRERAELRKLCHQLQQYASVIENKSDASDLERMGALQARRLRQSKCL